MTLKNKINLLFSIFKVYEMDLLNSTDEKVKKNIINLLNRMKDLQQQILEEIDAYQNKNQEIFTDAITHLNELPLYVYTEEFMSADAQKQLQLERLLKIKKEISEN